MRSAMTNLHEIWGLSTADIARALNVTQRVARLARDGRETADGAYRLDAFLWRLRDAGVDEPAAWMGAPIVEGFTVTRWHLYAAGRLEDLLSNAEGRLDDEAMLDGFDPALRAASALKVDPTSRGGCQ